MKLEQERRAQEQREQREQRDQQQRAHEQREQAEQKEREQREQQQQLEQRRRERRQGQGSHSYLRPVGHLRGISTEAPSSFSSSTSPSAAVELESPHSALGDRPPTSKPSYRDGASRAGPPAASLLTRSRPATAAPRHSTISSRKAPTELEDKLRSMARSSRLIAPGLQLAGGGVAGSSSSAGYLTGSLTRGGY